MKQCIPANLDIEKLLLDNLPMFKNYRDNFIHILHLITEIPARNKALYDEDGWVPINAKILQKRIRNYKLYLDYFVRYDVLERNNQYIPGQKSRKYRFTLKYRTICKTVEIDKYTLIKNISSRKERQKFSKEKNYPYLSKYFNGDLSIDFDAASEYLFQRYKNDCKKGVKNPALKYNIAMLSAAKIRDREYYFHVDQTVNRLHTNLTACKSGLRKFITYLGKDLVSIDLVNSQPWISTILLGPKFYEKESSYPFFNIYNISSSSNLIPFFPSPHIMLVKNEVILDGVAKEDTQFYIENVINGTLYEYLTYEIKKRRGVEINDRKEIKKIIFTVLFSDNRFIGQQEAWAKKMFRDIFPTVYAVFKAFKKSNSANLPILLQRMESKLILDYVSKRISREKPNMPIFTIHDSVVCPVGKEYYVKEVLIQECIKCLGIAPSIRYEYWS